MSMRELVAAGAPELPPSYFYRVRPFLRTSLSVQVRRQRALWGSEEVTSALVDPANYTDALHAVVSGCQLAAEMFADQHDRRRAMALTSRFIGDHDPKGGRRG